MALHYFLFDATGDSISICFFWEATNTGVKSGTCIRLVKELGAPR
jgi:hypothetical protein